MMALVEAGLLRRKPEKLKGEFMNRQATTWFLRLLALAAGTIFIASSLQAQVDTGSITGAITDASGAVVGSAKVTLTNEGTGILLSTTTGSDGIFEFSPVRIGSYKLDASSQGFKTEVQSHVQVDVGAQVLVNFKLQAGSVSETVEVTSAAPLLQTQDASIGQVINSRGVNDLPLNGRNFTFLAQLSAGVNTPQADTRGNAGSGAFAANGLRPAQNNYMLDGIDNNSDTVDFLNGTNFVVLPPVDAIQEFKVQTSDFSAEFGRSGAAVLNATIKSGTNNFHGTGWEFFRNDKLDAADYFEDAGHVPKGELRQNQFGASFGGPVIKNKIFFFGDYEGLRRIQGTILTGSVPTLSERNSGYTDLSDLITGQSTSPARPDALGRDIPVGAILDPATTRPVTAGSTDPVSGLVATSTGYVRDPFGTCGPSTTNFTLSACNLNQLPAGRLDANAIKLLNLYPTPTSSALFSNYANSPKLSESRNSFDTRLDLDISQRDQVFARFSYVDDPQFIPGIFGGLADGGGFQQGNQTALAQQSALAWTHVFSPTTVNVARAGLNYLHTTRVSPDANDLTNLPGQFGIQDVPQAHENGGLPAFGINGLQTLGSNAFLPSDEVSSTIQVTDDLTKIYGKHTFKMGFEYQHVKFSTLQPPWSRGEYDYGGNFTDIPNVGGGSTGRAEFLLTPTATTVANGISNVGGATTVDLSNISLTDDGKNYYGTYFQDDWKVTQKLTLNLGLRWDFFGLVFEHHSNQANFVPGGPPTGGPMYIIPEGPNANNLSSSFTSLLAKDGIALDITNAYGSGLGNSQKANFAPRVGFAYQVSPKLVARGGFGLFYNGFENRGFSPNLGENYPFQFNFTYTNPNDATPITFPGCSTAGPGTSATFETGFACTPLSPLLVNASGLDLRGIQFHYVTPYSMSGNFTLQYQLTNSLSMQAGYVTSLGRHLEVFPNSNNPTSIAPATTNPSTLIPFPDFGRGNSYAITEGSSSYNALQTKIEKQFTGGLNLLATYTYSKVLSDAFDLLNGGSVGVSTNGCGGCASGQNGYRAPDVPGFGIGPDRGLAPFDIRNVFHFSGGYQLPFGKGKRFMADAGGVTNAVVGGWSINFIATLQDGQPISITCPTPTASAMGCGALFVKGQSPKVGLHTDSNGVLSWIGNGGAFTQPCVLGAGDVPIPNQPTGCVPVTGAAALGGVTQITGPGFHRLDFSTFKDFPLNERFTLQFRAELFNVFNHPNFNAPGFGGNGVTAIPNSLNYTSSNFGEIGSTRDAPYDPRQIQFAMKVIF
jgi:Carboxypeptidase regulatory-like domain/TonB dependent receptor